MKKLIIFLIIGMMLLSMTGCQEEASSSNTGNTGVLKVEDGMVRYDNDGKTEDVISLEELLSKTDNTSVIDGKEIELFVEDGYIVWNYIGETSTHKLVALSALAGPQGSKGDTGAQGIQGEKGETGATGAAGKDGTNAYIWVKYLNVDPEDITDDTEVELLDETSDYMGIYYGTLSSAPDDIDSYSWYRIKGEKGDTGEQGIQGIQGETGAQGIQGEKGAAGANAYVWIMYAESDPTVNTNVTISQTPNNYMGVYSGLASEAPANASEYQWFKIKGETGATGTPGAKGDKGDTGATGAAGANAYVWIMYAESDPTVNADVTISATPNNYMGVYSGSASVAPANASDYQWFKIKGESSDTAATSGSYLDDIAIFTCSKTHKDQFNGTFSTSSYIGQNTGVSLSNDYGRIMLNTGNKYLIEVNGTITVKSQNINNFTVTQTSGGNWQIVCLYKIIDEAQRSDFSYTGGFNCVGTVDGSNGFLLPVTVSNIANSGVATSFSYDYSYTIKIYKID